VPPNAACPAILGIGRKFRFVPLSQRSARFNGDTSIANVLIPMREEVFSSHAKTNTNVRNSVEGARLGRQMRDK